MSEMEQVLLCKNKTNENPETERWKPEIRKLKRKDTIFIL